MDFGATSLDYAAIASAGVAVLIVALLALAVAVLVAMAYWFAPALVVLNGEQPIAALQKSFAASWRNFGAFLLYGLIYIVLAIVVSIPMGLGLAGARPDDGRQLLRGVADDFRAMSFNGPIAARSAVASSSESVAHRSRRTNTCRVICFVWLTALTVYANVA